MTSSLARTLMVQGTTSSAGKSLLVAALCRIFRQAGISVAPFKAQNMALNSAVTTNGGEIGRAQAVQAEAAGVDPSVDMNPILLKPEGERRSQVVVLGKVMGSMTASDYHERKPQLRQIVAESLGRLRRSHELVVIEGAGSPAEINLKERDLVNMFVARLANAPVLLVGDIDRGGVFASFVGTMELLEPHERSLVRGFVVNKFRGERALLESGLEWLSQRTGVPVAGVIPYISDLRIADEDSLSIESRINRKSPPPDVIDLAVVCFPRISNYDDIQPFEHVSGVTVRFVTAPEEVGDADLLILPGSKTTLSDLAWVRSTGFEGLIRHRAKNGKPVLGLCGGCQMLGESIADPDGVESSSGQGEGLHLLPLKTHFSKTKTTAQVTFKVRRESFWVNAGGDNLHGYEIHMGLVEQTNSARVAPFEITTRNGTPVNVIDGAADESGMVMGTMIHGLFENQDLREGVIHWLRKRRGMHGRLPIAPFNKDAEYDRLAGIVRSNLDLSLISKAIDLGSVMSNPVPEVQIA